ncbi:hypothetical protein NIES4103_14780 [Nostoc sp. NIES-4103]|nr:hypothetical protein NIES4103_14780 [Nostoc sp. NIES-4103]
MVLSLQALCGQSFLSSWSRTSEAVVKKPPPYYLTLIKAGVAE